MTEPSYTGVILEVTSSAYHDTELLKYSLYIMTMCPWTCNPVPHVPWWRWTTLWPCAMVAVDNPVPHVPWWRWTILYPMCPGGGGQPCAPCGHVPWWRWTTLCPMWPCALVAVDNPVPHVAMCPGGGGQPCAPCGHVPWWQWTTLCPMWPCALVAVDNPVPHVAMCPGGGGQPCAPCAIVAVDFISHWLLVFCHQLSAKLVRQCWNVWVICYLRLMLRSSDYP